MFLKKILKEKSIPPQNVAPYFNAGDVLKFGESKIFNRTEEKIYFQQNESLSSLEIWTETTKKISIPLPLIKSYSVENRGQGSLHLLSIDEEARIEFLLPGEKLDLSDQGSIENLSEQTVEIHSSSQDKITIFTKTFSDSYSTIDQSKRYFIYERENKTVYLSSSQKEKKASHCIYNYCAIKG